MNDSLFDGICRVLGFFAIIGGALCLFSSFFGIAEATGPKSLLLLAFAGLCTICIYAGMNLIGDTYKYPSGEDQDE